MPALDLSMINSLSRELHPTTDMLSETEVRIKKYKFYAKWSINYAYLCLNIYSTTHIISTDDGSSDPAPPATNQKKLWNKNTFLGEPLISSPRVQRP